MNKVILQGRIGQIDEIRYAGETPVLNFTLATDESYTNRNGERISKAEWHKIVAWDKRATVINQYCQKGDQLLIEGKNQTRSWDDQDGNKRYTTEVLLQNFEFGAKTARSEETTYAPQQNQSAPQQPSQPEPPADNAGFDDLPFR